MSLDHPVLSSLLPVVVLIGIGFAVGRLKLIRGAAVRDLSNLVFLVLVQALLFRTMATAHLERLDLRSVALYYIVAGAMFLALLVAREQAASGDRQPRPIAATVAQAVKNAVLHPVPLPIIAGFLYSLTGLGLHPVVERPLRLLGDAFGPVALVLVGVTLAQTVIGPHLKGALVISVLKTIVPPMLMAAAGWALGLRGVPLAVMVVAAALPVGANVFLFSQRYKKAEDLVTASVAVSTAMALGTITVVMALLARLGP